MQMKIVPKVDGLRGTDLLPKISFACRNFHDPDGRRHVAGAMWLYIQRPIVCPPGEGLLFRSNAPHFLRGTAIHGVHKPATLRSRVEDLVAVGRNRDLE